MENIPRDAQNETVNNGAAAQNEQFDQAEQAIYDKHFFRQLGRRAEAESRKAEEDSLENLTGVGELVEGLPDVASESWRANFERDLDESNQQVGAAERAMREMIWHNYSTAGQKNSQLKRAEEIYEFVLDQKRADFRREHPADAKMQKTPNGPSVLTEQKQLKAIKAEREKLRQSSPEAFLLMNGRELMRNKRQAMDRELIETPYVAKRERELMENMRLGAPTFVQGHLGGGKTELARSAARKVTTEKVALEAAKEMLARENKDLEPGTNKYYVALEKLYRNEYRKLERKWREGDAEVHERLEPLVIQGTRETTTQDLFMDKTLKLKAETKDVAGQKTEMDRQLEIWKAEHARELAGKRPEELARDEEEFKRLFMGSKQVHGAEVVNVENQLVKGMREGRPVIIDEANTIPTEVLMSMNGILTMRPGQICPIPGTNEAVKIAEGFSITMTGNVTSNLIEYLGTNELNLANASRFVPFEEYQYLPQSVNGVFERRRPENDELFRVVMSTLVDRRGNLELPEMQKSVEQVYRLCQLARETQNLFSGKNQTNEDGGVNIDASGDKMEQRLRKSFLSMRNLIDVMQKWDKGNEDLNVALWDGFVAGVGDAADRNLIVRLARKHGFFVGEGWSESVDEISQNNPDYKIELSDLQTSEYGYEPKELERMPWTETVEMLFGEKPKRTEYPEITLEDIPESDEATEEDLERLEGRLAECQTAIAALEVLSEQCGCPKETA